MLRIWSLTRTNIYTRAHTRTHTRTHKNHLHKTPNFDAPLPEVYKTTHEVSPG